MLSRYIQKLVNGEATDENLPISMDTNQFKVGSPSVTVEGDSGECSSDVDVKEGLIVVQTTIDLMNNNKFVEAIQLIKPKADVSMYHSMSYGCVLFLQAGFSMERDVIDKATEVLTSTVELCSRFRHPRGMMESLSSWVFGQSMDNYTATELQAEIFYAEANLLLSCLTFLQDESLMSFVKGGLKIRSCHSLYKQLYQWLLTCEQEGAKVEENFAAGVRMGYGFFNLFLSLLPSRIMKLLEFIGFSAKRGVGLEELERGAASPTFRASFCSSFLLFYYTVAAAITGIEIEVDHAEELLQPQLTKYPSSVLFLYYKGRVSAMRGCVDQAVESFKIAMEIQDEWRQVHHLCWWELAWCYCLKGEWSEAAKYCDDLYRNSKWSKASFLYMKASFLLMQRNVSPGKHNEITDDQLADMMRNIAPLKQRIAGKSFPVEKFAVAKSKRYLDGATLPLCGMELLYSHNAFLLLRNNPVLLQGLLQETWKQMLIVEQTQGTNPCYNDDWCVVTFLQGVIFRVLDRQDEAEKCFMDVIERAELLQHDDYTVPASCAELGLLYIKTGNIEKAEKKLEAARTNYKGYHLESRIHFRIHEGYNKIHKLRNEQK